MFYYCKCGKWKHGGTCPVCHQQRLTKSEVDRKWKGVKKQVDKAYRSLSPKEKEMVDSHVKQSRKQRSAARRAAKQDKGR